MGKKGRNGVRRWVWVVGEVMGGSEILDFRKIWRRGTEEKCTAAEERLGERGKNVT
jgi:hypothetical protein